MKLTVERLPESQVRLEITADDDEFKQALDKAARKVGAQVTVPGFRRGKAPRGIVERMYGRGVFLEEANRELMDDLYRRAIEQEDLAPVGPPEVDITGTDPTAFTAVVPVFPEVDPGSYQEVRADPIDASIDEAAVDEVIERLRRARSPWVDVPEEGMELGEDKVLRPKTRTPREGDQVTVDYQVREGDTPFQEPVEDAIFILGESNLFPRLREEIERMQAGATASFSIDFAEDDETVNTELRGKTLDYTVTLKEIKQRDLLPLDDDFAKSVADAETVEALRQEVHADLHQGRTSEGRTEVLNQIIDRIAEGATVDPPPAMVDEAVEDDVKDFRNQLAQRRTSFEEYLRVSGQTEEQLKSEMRPAAARRLRTTLLLRAIAEREQISVSDDEVEAEIARLSGGSGGGGADPQRLQQLYQSDYFRGVLRNDLFERRLTEYLIETATEGRGAVLNGWVAPEPEPVLVTEQTAEEATGAAEAGGDGETDVAEATVDVAPGEGEPGAAGSASDDGTDATKLTGESDADAAGSTDEGETDAGVLNALDNALTTGAMPGQPGDIAATATTSDPDAAVSVAEVAAEPDAAQAAATGHEAEDAEVAAQAPDDAITPEEREAQGEPGAGGSLPNPTY